MKKTIYRLCLEFLALALLLPMAFALPVSAENQKPEVYLAQYEDDFTADTPNERIELGASAVYGGGKIAASGAEAADRWFKIHLNRNKAAAVGNIVTEYTIKQTGLMSSSDGQIQMFLLSAADSIIADIRWRKTSHTSADIRIGATSGALSLPIATDTSELTITTQYNTVTETLSVWVGDEKVIDDSSDYVKVTQGNAACVSFKTTTEMTIEVESFKWYYAEAEGLPKVQRTLVHEDFETDDETPESTDTVTIGTAGVSYITEEGALKTSTAETGGKTAFTLNLTEDGSALTGEYVIEVLLHNADGGENSHRLWFDSNMYLAWNPNLSGLRLDYWDAGGRHQNDLSPKTINDFGATGSALKVTAKFNTEEGTVKLWLNDREAWEHTYPAADASTYTSISTVKLSLYKGSVELADFHCYRPVPKPMTDEEKIQKVADGLADTVFYGPLTANGYLVDDLNLIESGANDVDITWSLSDGADQFIDLSTGYVTPGETEANVTLTATLESGSTTVTKPFTFKIPALGASVDGTPAFLTMARREEFDAFDADTMAFTNGAVGHVEVTDGKLNISTSASDSSATKANIYLTKEKREITGKFAMDFVMEKPSTCEGPQATLTNESGAWLSYLRWYTNGMVRFFYPNEEGARAYTDFAAADFGITNKVKVTIKVDTEAGLMTLLLNNKVAAENYKFMTAGPISNVLFLKDNAVFSSQIEHLRFYYTTTDDERAVRLDAADLTYDLLFKSEEILDGVIAYDVDLPTRGMRGTTITWDSSHPEILSNDGVVTRPDVDTEVTLTALVEAGEEDETVQIKVTVLRNGEGDLVILKKDYDTLTLKSILTGSLVGTDLISDDLDLYTIGPYGSTISWATNDDTLIKADGTVIRPENQEGNIYTTITATVINGDYSLSKEFRLGVLPETYTFDNIPLPERYETVYKAEYTTHTDGWSSSSEETSISGYFVDDWATCRGWGGRIVEHDGYVEMTRERVPAEGQATRFIYPLQPSAQAIGDLAVVQYSMTKEGTGEIKQQFDGGSTQIYWQNNNTFRIRHRDDEGNLTESFTSAYTGTVQVTFMTDEKSRTVTLWLNDDCVLYEAKPYSATAAAMLSRITTDIEGSNFLTLKLTEYDTFTTYPTAHKRPEQDKIWLTEDLIRDGVPAPASGKLASDLNLVTEGKYGSTITWESSNEDYITNEGIVTRPPNWPNEEEVTMTATISYGCFAAIKKFTFNVMPYYTEDETIAEKDDEFLCAENWNFLTFNDTSFDAVTTSLNLLDKGPYGSTYLWKTNNSKVITETGRVIRPYWDGSPQTVTMTAVIVYGTAVRTKDFTFTVLPDEMLYDPKHMSDEDFLGVWDGSDWSTEGKIDYGYGRNLGKVEAAAKAGDYTLAKEELLAYMKNRSASFASKPLTRNSAYTEAFIMSGIRDSENHNHFATIGPVTSHEYKEHIFSLKNSVVKGAVTNYKVAARYNEKSTALVLSSEYHMENMRPRVEVIVNGSKRTYYTCGDTVIRGGQYEYTNFSDLTEMPVTYFGDLQSEGLSDLLLQFDFTDIKQTDDVTDVYLYLYAKIDEPYANSKELVVCREGTDWNASTVTMRSITEYTFNYNGLPGKDTWRNVGNAESEYILQSARFSNHSNAAAEYAYTGNEKYAYTVIWDLMDFIIDTQGRFVYNEEVRAGRVPSSLDWEDLGDVVRYGAYPRALDLGLKLESIVNMFDVLKKSRYMTPDACTAILKNLWHGANELDIFLNDPANAGLGANQKILEAECYSTAAAFMPEFSASKDFIKNSIEITQNLMEASFFPDGSYIEGSDGYTSMALDQFYQFWEKILILGYDYTDEAKELLSKATRYVANLGSNGGVSIAWGDNGKSRTRITEKGQNYYDLTHDEITYFINTYGRKGTMPDWTSQFYEGNMLAIMRSDWSDDGTYLFMPSSSFQTHSHSDANQLILNAYQRALLIDGGYYNYDGGPERDFVKSTRGHNTVEIDNTSQALVSGMGTSILTLLSEKNSWVSNANYDFCSITTHSNKAQAADDLNNCVDHRRTVTFLKPNIIIVSDRMSPDMSIPEEAAKPHSYKQLWHMSAQATQAADGSINSNAEKRQFFSDFTSGAQIKIASADTDAEMMKAMGYDTEAWGVGSVAPYGYYSKENILGPETFDTVLLPYKNQGDVVAEHISLGDDIENHDATAMKITVTIDDEVNYIYYMLDYGHTTGGVHAFADYTSDAEMALVRTSEDGEILETILYNGSYIKTTSDETLLSAGAQVEALSSTIVGSSAEIYTSNDVNIENVSIKTGNSIQTVLYNGKTVEFEITDGMLTPSNQESNEVKNDPSADKGGVMGGSGGAAGGGSEKPGESEEPGKTEEPGTVGGEGIGKAVFDDIDNHWAEKSITRMAEAGIVKGDGETFRPDESISRAELVTMVARVLKLEIDSTETEFSDVPAESWYAPYVKAVLDMGIISADTHFRPNDSITREEMSKILSAASALMTGADMKVPEDFSTTYQDTDAISEWAKPFVQYASYKGLMNGMDGGNFAPRQTATRAQVATVLDRMLSSKTN